MKITRCKEGTRLAKAYFENYKKVLNAGGDWLEAFADTRVHDHTENCLQCQNFVAARRTGFEDMKDGTYPSPIISGGEVLDLTPVQSGNEDLPF